MNDRPQVQLKLSITDTDTIRNMIRRDYAETLTQVNRLESIGEPERDDAWKEDWAMVNRRLMGTEQVALIFSVALPRR